MAALTSSAEATSTAATSTTTAPKFSFGVIADIQYADADDGEDFKRTVVRRYRNTLRVLHEAVDGWMSQQEQLGYPIQLIAQLGDIIDGRCKERDGGNEDVCLARILSEFQRINVPRLDIIGNHELYNFSRQQLLDVAHGPLHSARDDDPILGGSASTWYSYSPAPGIRFVVLDAYDVSMLNGTDAASTAAARSILAGKNPNNFEEKGVDWTTGLVGKGQRFVPYNGAIGKGQLGWLRATLVAAQGANEKCVVLSHISLVPGACSISCCIWNYEEVLEVLHNPTMMSSVGSSSSLSSSSSSSESKSTAAKVAEFGPTPVICCLYGHAHKGGYRMDRRGIHHITFQAPLEAVGDEMAHAALDLMEDHLVVRGHGRVTSREHLQYPCHPASIDPVRGVIDEVTLLSLMEHAAIEDRSIALDLLLKHDGIFQEALMAATASSL